MKHASSAGQIDYFGKIPARGDFIKAAQDVPLMGVLDQWLSQVMNLLAADARWKTHYDALAPLDFALVGTRRKHAIGGQLIASRDQSGRRYPFIVMRTLDVPQAGAFLAHSPLVLAPLWERVGALVQDVLAVPDPRAPLRALHEAVIELDASGDTGNSALCAFLEQHSIASIGAALGLTLPFGQLMLALGLLLQPASQNPAARLEKSLLLPLPEQPSLRYPMAALWLNLIAPFLLGSDRELALFIVRSAQRAVLVVGFGGASPQTLHGLIDPEAGRVRHIDIGALDWIGPAIADQAPLRHLASYLDQPSLSLTLARSLFLRTFIKE